MRPRLGSRHAWYPQRCEEEEEEEEEEDEEEEDLSGELEGFRLTAYTLYHNPHFDGFILVCIAINCVCMALDDPVTPTPPSPKK